ncbi:hypothetical protein HU200_045723 [Digitaria exilis]|uniref:DNA-directed DNA polymerase family B exonuclease domain-containing protein n=1 Tax=Digitaria exilis TaxID=1010633 RepID=A0A835B029_9POAL|nr:hypothetical protein HU200_045723 [Digitaria exilis]
MSASQSPPEPSTPGTPTPVLSVRIVSIDYYMSPPLPGFDFSRSPFHGALPSPPLVLFLLLPRVSNLPLAGIEPVATQARRWRRFRSSGSTAPPPRGRRLASTSTGCVLPYLYVPCPEELLHNVDKGNSYITGLLSDLEKALQELHCAIDFLDFVSRYYPHEVSRAATLLLLFNFRVVLFFNRSLQPYESHIPYLLHFLIDYNLYGMGHIHVKDFKFRPPLPDDFHTKSSLRRKVDWFTVLERILNEKYKMYTSLSQTTEGTKMVQSLVAIWEEIERLRLLEETKYADLGRPLREEVLKGFLHDIKYESALSMLFSQEVPQHKVSATEDSERLERCFKSLTDIVGTVTFSQDDYCDDIDVGNSAGMQDKPNASLCSGSFKQTVQTISPERNSEYVVSSSVTQRMLSQLSDEGEKQVDAEALGLLSWLASSQAAEDPTTDDELINEVILSPLFGKKSIEVALESAHLDFDSASQQECQDILDSVDPVSAEEPNTHTSCLGPVEPNSTASVVKTIPQVDGSSDESPKVSQEYDRSKITRKTVGSPSYTCTKSSSKSAKIIVLDLNAYALMDMETSVCAIKKVFIISVCVSGHLNYSEAIKEEAHSLTLSPNSPTRNSSTKVAVDGDVMESISIKEIKHLDEWHDFSQISAGNEKDKLTPLSQIGFRDPASIGGGQQLTILSMEVVHSFLFSLTESRGELRPDPWFDAINAVSLAIEDDADNTVEVHVFIRDNSDKSHRRRNLDGIAGCNVDVFPEEKDLLNNLISAVCSIDPDILVGWEIQLGSLGFLAERAAYLGIGLLRRISRTPPHELNHPPKAPVDDSSQVLAEASSADDVIDDVSENDWSHSHASGIHVGGRIVLNLWRLMRSEVKLNNYSLEAVADEVLRRKIPLIPSRVLNRWFAQVLNEEDIDA